LDFNILDILLKVSQIGYLSKDHYNYFDLS
jgi:hypothetical protein